MAPRDVEPVEAVDLEPIALDEQPEQTSSLRFSRGVIVTVVAGIALWIVVAVVSSNHSGHRATAPISTPATSASTPPPAAAPRATSGVAWNELALIGSGRYAVVVDDQVFIYDHGEKRLPFQPGPVAIEGQNGGTLALRFRDSVALVPTDFFGLANDFPIDSVALPAVAREHWWVVRAGEEIERDGGVNPTDITHAPAGIRVMAAITGGFVGRRLAGGSLVIWNGRSVYPIGGTASSRLVAVGAHIVAFTNCQFACPLGLYDLRRGSVTFHAMTGIPVAGSFSPDESRIAVQDTFGSVRVIDTVTGSVRATSPPAILSYPPQLTFGWTSDGQAVVVAAPDRIAMLNPNTSATEWMEARGVQQILPLP